MTETNSTDQPAECSGACTEHHTYGPDCAATTADYDPNAGMRDRYIEALYQAGETRAFAPYLDREQAGELADAVLAARDVYLNNVRRISKQQTTQLAELYMTTKKRAEQAEAKLAAFHEGEEPHHDEHTVTTPAQWIWRWNRATLEQRLDIADRFMDNAAQASDCFLNHKAAVEDLPRARVEMDRLRDEHRHEQELSADLRARLKATSDACSDATTLLYQIGELHTSELSNEFGATECRTCRDPWPCDTANLLATLDQPERTAPSPEWNVWPMGTLSRLAAPSSEVPPALRGPQWKPRA